MDNYDKLVEKIASLAKVDRSEVDRRVEAKRAKLSGLVSKEGAAQIVAAEMGINFDKEKMKISELVSGMKRANVIGKVVQIFPVREFNKNGRQGKVANLIVADESSNMRLVLWDTNHIGLIENSGIVVGDVIEISNGAVRENEMHLSSFSDIKKSNQELGEVITAKVFASKKISEVRAGENVNVRAVIVQMFEPRYFEVCPECRKRAIENECKIHGKITAEKRALLNLVLDDGSDSIRAVLFGEAIKSLGFSDEEIFSLEKFTDKKLSLIGEERRFVGNIKSNSLYNINEFNVESMELVKVDELIKELETVA